MLHNWLVLMHPEEFARPVKQQVLAQEKGYAYVCKQLLLFGVCNAFLYGGAFAWKHLLAFMHTAPWHAMNFFCTMVALPLNIFINCIYLYIVLA